MKRTNDNTKAKWFMIEKEQAPLSINTLPFIDKKDKTDGLITLYTIGNKFVKNTK